MRAACASSPTVDEAAFVFGGMDVCSRIADRAVQKKTVMGVAANGHGQGEGIGSAWYPLGVNGFCLMRTAGLLLRSLITQPTYGLLSGVIGTPSTPKLYPHTGPASCARRMKLVIGRIIEMRHVIPN